MTFPLRRLARTLPAFFAALLMLGAVQPAAAADAKDIRLMERAALTLSDAIDRAEESQTGHALAAEIDDEDGVVVYEVSIAKDGRVFDVRVDANDGKILRVKEDK